jgi:hypothetical protein
MKQREYRLLVLPDELDSLERVFVARSWCDGEQNELYLCGSCSIVFAGESAAAIRHGTTGRCANCGAVNRLYREATVVPDRMARHDG